MKPNEIKELRRVLGLTQGGLALALGCARSSVEHYEQGWRKPNEVFDARLRRMARKAGVKVVDTEDEDE